MSRKFNRNKTGTTKIITKAITKYKKQDGDFDTEVQIEFDAERIQLFDYET